ncbi:MAG: 5'/3'-nucleotidase SurE [Planctomycetes bacterium]|nr:5'/3'-nucleotidase SurE [Planctomycetota bacterium]
MNILLVNDDGFDTDGLLTFCKVLGRKHRVTVVAPVQEQSGTSHSISILAPIFIQQIPCDCKGVDYMYAVKGTPADCVKLAMSKLLKRRPDIVISGINLGINVGLDVFYSGTVAAAIESHFWGITAFAVSVERPSPLPASINFDRYARLAYSITSSILKTRPAGGSVFNINIPFKNPKGLKFTRQDMALIPEEFVRSIDPRGRHYYWMKAGPEMHWSKKRPGTLQPFAHLATDT